jgi:hypothetical protein
MELYITASDLTNPRDSRWFSHKSRSIIDGVFASAAISPLIPPYETDGRFYVDGGLYHNSPIVKALDEGATKVIALVLAPLEQPLGSVDLNKFDGHRGPVILSYYYEVIDHKLLVSEELTTACQTYPDRTIVGNFPTEMPYSLTDFNSDRINEMVQLGRSSFRANGLQNLCEFVDVHVRAVCDKAIKSAKAGGAVRSLDHVPAVWLLVAGVVGSVLGCVATLATKSLLSQTRPRTSPLTSSLLNTETTDGQLAGP